LCVGIEDPADLIDDLQHALLEAGVVTWAANDFIRIPYSINKAVEKLVAPAVLDEAPKEIPTADTKQWFVSAPGKVILFGEHAVVHGVTAVAASVDLRCYGLTSPRNDGKVSVHLTSIGDYTQEWDIDKLPWDVANPVRLGDKHPETLDQRLIDAIISKVLPPADQMPPKSHGAALSFLYLYMTITHGAATERPSFHFVCRSTLPVGAGLGSSASYSTCVASTILLLNKRISIPPRPRRTQPPSSAGDPGHVHISHQGRRAIPPDVAEEVNRWAFVSEKVLHGNPSGVDNSVVVYGGALSYTRPGFGKKSGMDQIQGFRKLKFLLVDSKVPRDTKQLVAGVAAKKSQEPELVGNILSAIQSIADEARRALADPELPREDLLIALSSLIKENHAHLISLGVSHPTLETIREKTAAHPYSLSTKLTGAGGGGCAVTLIPDEFQHDTLERLIATLIAENFQPYVTAVGGSGLGILSPYRHSDPGDASAASIEKGLSSADDDVDRTISISDFSSVGPDSLPQWTDDLGRWLYV